MSGDSGARHDRVSIKDETFFEMPINLPCEQEQDKIASFLSVFTPFTTSVNTSFVISTKLPHHLPNKI